MKYGNVTLGQVEAAINKLGGQEMWDAWLRGEKTVEVKEAISMLFDKHGRRIPEGLRTDVCDADRNFQLNRPKLEQNVDFAKRIMRLQSAFVGILPDLDFGITVEQFKQETEHLLALIRDNSQIANILNGVWLPVILPKLTTDDLGTVLEQYLEAVGNSYVKTFNNWKFYNHRKGALAGEVSIVSRSRHNQLIAKMKQGPVMGIHFPNPLQGFSIKASREQMATLPEGFVLSGLDTAIAMIMHPDILANGSGIPGLDLAAFSWQSADYSLNFRVSVGILGFGGTGSLAGAYAGYSGGLLFLG